MAELQTVTIAKLSAHGEGIAFTENAEIYVPQALVGEKLELEVGEPFVEGSKRRPGKIVKVLEGSKERECNVPCRHYAECGGCQLMHLKYMAQLESKNQDIKQALDKVWAKAYMSCKKPLENNLLIAKLDQVVGMADSASSVCRFKSIRYFAQIDGHLKSGFFAPRTHNLVHVEQCMLEPLRFSEIANKLTLVLDQGQAQAFTAPAPIKAEKYSKKRKIESMQEINLDLSLDKASLEGNTNINTTTATNITATTTTTELQTKVKALVLREGDAGEILVCLLVATELSSNLRALLQDFACKEGIASFYVGLNSSVGNSLFTDQLELLYGKAHITKTILGQHFKVGPNTFLQVNYEICEKLYAAAVAHCSEAYCSVTSSKDERGATVLASNATTMGTASDIYSDTPLTTLVKSSVALDASKTQPILDSGIALDLCCGVGTMSLALAKHFKHVIGVEIVELAVEAAYENAVANNFDENSVRFIASDLSKVLPSLLKPYEQQPVRAVIADPARVGIGEENARLLSKLKSPCRISLIYCALPALQRELPVFLKGGFKVDKIQGFDMFPHSSHIETLVCLSKD